MITKPQRTALGTIVLVLMPFAASANDADLTYGGTPRLLTGNSTVSMKREFINIQIGDNLATVDCRFTFVNHGPACKVRMGFPDEGAEPGEAEAQPGVPAPQPKGTFKTFESWVNGKRVKTTVIPAEEPGSVWHTKRVAFPARGTLEVRDRYTVKIGSAVAYDPIAIHMTKYVLHTGSSWRGPLGRSEVRVVFTGTRVGGPIHLMDFPRNGEIFVKEARVEKRSVYYRGPSRPTVSGRTLRFVRSNWRPTTKDDIFLVFALSRRVTAANRE